LPPSGEPCSISSWEIDGRATKKIRKLDSANRMGRAKRASDACLVYRRSAGSPAARPASNPSRVPPPRSTASPWEHARDGIAH
jgi:hypothetical protein